MKKIFVRFVCFAASFCRFDLIINFLTMYKAASIATILLILVLGASCRKPPRPKNRVVPLNAPLQKVGDNFGVAAGEHLIPETIPIPSGKFMMGSEPDEDADPNEQPRHSVSLDGFEIGRLEVTNAQFESFVKAAGYENEKWRETTAPDLENYPAINVSWNDAVEYCKWLSKITNRQYRLPTEAEWEYAAGGAKGVRFSWGDDWDTSMTNAGKLHKETVKAASYQPNAFGLYDMTGNVWELCSDWYDPKYYSKGIESNPQGPNEGLGRIQRGGALNSPEKYARIAFRSRAEPDVRMNTTGFRVVAAAQKLTADSAGSTGR